MKPKYNTWIRKKKIVIFACIALLLNILATLSHIWLGLTPKLILTGLSLPFIYIVIVLSYTYYQFSESGGDYQGKIHQLIVDKIKSEISPNVTTTLLDIGCGSGSLVIRVLKKFPNLQATAIDYWGNDWDYSQN